MKTLKEFNDELENLEKNEQKLSQYGLGQLRAFKEIQELFYNLSKIEANTYSIADIHHCVDNWASEEVTQEEIERFINQ